MSAEASRPTPPERRRPLERRRYITVPAFAARLHVHEDTVRKWIRAGGLPAYRFPPGTGQWRIRKADAARFEQDGRFTMTPDPLPKHGSGAGSRAMG